MSNKKSKVQTDQKTEKHATFADETVNVKIPGMPTPEGYNPKIFTEKTPSKPDKLPDYMDETQLDQETIKNLVKEIQNTPPNKEKRTEYLSMKYPDFADRYPILFDMACREDFDFEKFNYMMRIRGQIAKKERTIEHASVEVGQKFYNMYKKK